ncbi:MarR family winged helix-turn-helix transcriptional regulator [Streptomyces sp. NPDC003027]
MRNDIDGARGPHDPGRTAAAIVRLLPDLHRALERRADQDFPHPKPPEGQLAILRLVRERPGITVRAAAEALLMKPNNVSALVSQMVTGGLLLREQDPADKRVAHLRVTDEALSRVSAVEELFRGYVLAGLDALDDEARASLAGAMPALEELARRIRPAVD